MNTKDPKLISLRFNDCINHQDLAGLARLMAEDHTFIDREGTVHQPKQVMVDGWKEFFKTFPKYRNTFNRVESRDNLVVLLGFAYWSEEQPHDPAIWTATIVGDLVHEWRVYADTPENGRRFRLA